MVVEGEVDQEHEGHELVSPLEMRNVSLDPAADFPTLSNTIHEDEVVSSLGHLLLLNHILDKSLIHLNWFSELSTTVNSSLS